MSDKELQAQAKELLLIRQDEDKTPAETRREHIERLFKKHPECLPNFNPNGKITAL